MLSSAGWDGFIYFFILEDHFVVKETKDLPTDQSSVLLQMMKKRVYLTEIK